MIAVETSSRCTRTFKRRGRTVSYAVEEEGEEPLRQDWDMQYLAFTKRGSNHDVIESAARESTGPNVSISRGLSSFHSKINLAVTTEIDLSEMILYLHFSTCIVP
jgi:hypothetical protein